MRVVVDHRSRVLEFDRRSRYYAKWRTKPNHPSKPYNRQELAHETLSNRSASVKSGPYFTPVKHPPRSFGNYSILHHYRFDLFLDSCVCQWLSFYSTSKRRTWTCCRMYICMYVYVPCCYNSLLLEEVVVAVVVVVVGSSSSTTNISRIKSFAMRSTSG
jgi:hypothetical protein